MLTKEKCLFALESLKPVNIYEFEAKGYLSFVEANSILKQLIKEHFELVDLLKRYDLENLSIEELDGWLGKLLWHVDKVNELTNKLFELSRVVNSKQEMIDELKKTINENIYKIFKNQPLKFEELKPNTWVWDNKIKEYRKIDRVNKKYHGIEYFNTYGWFIDFEENRFYRYEVK